MKTAEYEKLNGALYLWFTQQRGKWYSFVGADYSRKSEIARKNDRGPM
jgi:hypothetical protein